MKLSTLLPAALIVGSLAYGAGAIAGTYGGTFGNGGAAGAGGGGSGDITDVGSCSTGACFSSSAADDSWLGLGASAGRIEFDDQTVDEVNIVGAYHGINTQTPSHWEHIAGGNLASGVRALYVTGTLPDVNGSRAAEFVTTSSGAGSNSQYGILYTMAAGGTGTNSYVGMLSGNSAAGTGTHNPLAGTDFANGANLGVWGQSDATTTGTNVGLFGRTVNGAIAAGVWGTAGVTAAGYRQDSANYGVVGTATYAKNAGSTSERHVGVVGFGEGGDLNVGGYFGLTAGTPTFVSSALIADNGTAAANIFTARDNGTAVFTIADSGTTTAAQQVIATKDPSSTGASNASVYVNPATSASNEMLLACADNGTAVFSVDKEGDMDVRTIGNAGSGTCDSLVAGSVCVLDSAGSVVSTGGTAAVSPLVVVAPAVSAAVDPGFTQLYNEMSTAWFAVRNATSGAGAAGTALATRSGGGSTFAGLTAIGGIDSAQDTGSTQILQLDARREAGTYLSPSGSAITTRPLLGVTNAGTLVFGVHVNGTHGESTITPTALAANTDNYAGCTSTKVCRIGMGGGSYNLTGLVPSYTATLSERRTLCNVDSTGTLTLVDDATSTAANRFQLNANFAIVPERCVDIQYDLTSSRWRLVGGG